MYKETFLAHYYEIANLDHHQRWDPQEFHYICAEWNLGGFPVWLKYIPGISFRTDNEPFKQYMAGFTKKIVEMMKAESLFEPQGGPIIMSQSCYSSSYHFQRWFYVVIVKTSVSCICIAIV
ncbi:hypothetical protein MRB53_021850 [Persea americana]|nr:hypothetical protein MRB53_021850 [Persea americana]